jgi:hypothetical protein
MRNASGNNSEAVLGAFFSVALTVEPAIPRGVGSSIGEADRDRVQGMLMLSRSKLGLLV